MPNVARSCWPCSRSPPRPRLAADPKKDGKNLVPNGDFEDGTDTPARWQTVDGLTAFYARDPDPKHNKCVKFDTDVLQSQGYEWWAKFARAEALRATFGTLDQPLWAASVFPPRAQDAPKKLPTVEPKYDTLAGLDGVWYWSDFFPVETRQGVLAEPGRQGGRDDVLAGRLPGKV